MHLALCFLIAVAQPVDRHGDPLPAGAVARLGTVRMRADGQIHVSADGRTLLAVSHPRSTAIDLSDGRITKVVPLETWGPWLTALSSGGKVVVGAVNDFRNRPDSIRVWDTATGRITKTLPIVSTRFDSLAVSHDGTRAAVCSERDGTHIWDLTTGRAIGECREGDDAIKFSALHFSPDGKHLAIVSEDGIRLFETASAKKTVTFGDANDPFCGPAFSDDGKSIAVRNHHGEIRILSLPDAKLRRRITMDDRVGLMRFSPDGKTLAVACDDDGVRLLDAATGKAGITLPTGWVEDYRFTPDGRTLVSQGDILRVWDLADGKQKLAFEAHDGFVRAVEWLDSERITTAAHDATVRTWRADRGTPLLTFPGSANAFALSPDRRMWIAESDDNLVLRKVADGKEVRRWAIGANRSVHSAVFSPDGMHLACRGSIPGDDKFRPKKFAFVWEVDPGKLIAETPIGVSPDDIPTVYNGCLSFLPDGRSWFVRERRSGVFRRLDGAVWRTIPNSENDSLGLSAVSPDGRWLAYVNYSTSTVRLRDIASGGDIIEYPEETTDATTLRFSSDGRVLASVSYRSIRVRDLLSGKSALIARPDDDDAYCAAFSPDGRRLATASGTTALVWDLTKALEAIAPTAAPIADDQADALWADLAHADEGRAFRAIGRLSAGGAGGVELIRRKLPALVEPNVDTLIARLDSERFEVRQAASDELEHLPDAVVRRLLDARPSPEAAVRLRSRFAWTDPSPQWLRTVRAIAALEYSSAPDAGKLLSELAAASTWSRRAAEASAAFGRRTRLK